MANIAKEIRVGIIDDHVLLREGLSAVLQRTGRYDIVFEGETANDAVAFVEKHHPDVILLDLGIEGGGLEALRKIKDRNSDVFCVVLTSCDDPLKAMAALSMGAEGYILKGIKSDDLLQALEGILARKTYVSPDFAMRLVSAVNLQKSVEKPKCALNHREEQVITAVQHGLTNREVANQLKLSEQTVKFYMSSAMQKLGVRNRVSAVQEYQRQMAQGE